MDFCLYFKVIIGMIGMFAYGIFIVAGIVGILIVVGMGVHKPKRLWGKCVAVIGALHLTIPYMYTVNYAPDPLQQIDKICLTDRQIAGGVTHDRNRTSE